MTIPTQIYIISAIIILVFLIGWLWLYRSMQKIKKQLPDPDKHFLPERGRHFIPEKFKKGFAIRNDEGEDLLRTSKPLLKP